MLLWLFWSVAALSMFQRAFPSCPSTERTCPTDHPRHPKKSSQTKRQCVVLIFLVDFVRRLLLQCFSLQRGLLSPKVNLLGDWKSRVLSGFDKNLYERFFFCLDHSMRRVQTTSYRIGTWGKKISLKISCWHMPNETDACILDAKIFSRRDLICPCR